MYDTASEHGPAIATAIVLLVVLWLLPHAISLLADRGLRWAVALLAVYHRTSAMTKLAAGLMLLTGAVHLALIPSHEGITGVLFVINGLGFIALAAAAFLTSWWRRPAVLWLVATPEQRDAAARLLSDTRASIAHYRDPATAIAAGFKPGPVSSADPLRHFVNPANTKAILDPSYPQALVYAQTKHGLQLIGAMYQMPRAGQWGPDPGGPLTQWHQHEGICFSPFGFEFSFETPFWTCPVGSTSITTPPMLHVWIIDNGKEGPFAAELDKSAQKALQGS